MRLADTIHDRLVEALQPVHLDVLDESHQHNVPAGAQSHFKVTVVSASFANTPLLQRHRQVNAVLADLLEGPVHALGLHTFTEDEWQARGGEVPASPPCRGGSRADRAQ